MTACMPVLLAGAAIAVQAAAVTDPKHRVVITGMGIASVFGNDVTKFYDRWASARPARRPRLVHCHMTMHAHGCMLQLALDGACVLCCVLWQYQECMWLNACTFASRQAQKECAHLGVLRPSACLFWLLQPAGGQNGREAHLAL